MKVATVLQFGLFSIALYFETKQFFEGTAKQVSLPSDENSSPVKKQVPSDTEQAGSFISGQGTHGIRQGGETAPIHWFLLLWGKSRVRVVYTAVDSLQILPGCATENIFWQ